MKIAFIVLIGMCLVSAVDAEENLPLYDMSISFDISKNLIKGVSTITIPENTEINISTGNLEIKSVRLNGLLLDVQDKFKVRGKSVLEISFEGTFKEVNEDNENMITNTISDKGISLTEIWYPYIEGRAYYRLKAVVPEGFIAISEADNITVIDKLQEGDEKYYGKEYYFDFPYPLDKISFIAGKYMALKDTYNGIDIYVYSFSEDITDIMGYLEAISRARTYIKYTKNYIKMYEELIGPYPYKRFSIVENILPTGYSMPTFTLLGSSVMRLPFIVDTSLGHEILHQWFGNFIYNDYKDGNWLEGLTTYMSDHLFEKQKGHGQEYRKKLLIDYQSFRHDKEIDLKNFSQKTDFTSEAIGYGKGAMLFHMLYNEVGEYTFYDALKGLIKEKAFQEADWDDIKIAFENASGKNLEQFFNQWLYRKGEISIEIEDPRVIVLKGIPTVSFKFVQKDEFPYQSLSYQSLPYQSFPYKFPPYQFNLSLKINTDKGEFIKILEIKKENETFEIPLNGTPIEMIIDDDYDLMRRLSEKEYPPVIARLLGDEKPIIVVPEKDREKYEDFVNIFKDEGFIPKEEKEIKDENITSSSLLVSSDSPIVKRLFGKLENPGPGFSLIVKKNPLNESKVIAIIYGDSIEEIDMASKKIFHYKRYSFIRFEKGKNIEKKTDETEQGIRINLYEPVLLIQPSQQRLKGFRLDEVSRNIVRNISDKKIIYIGEEHTNYEEHKAQLDIITRLYENGNKFAIGMEMFQKPFQNVIDDYISGNITEKEFLKKSEYFKRWKYDYNLYREIINFAKANNISIVALNIRAEITENVSKGGLDILTDEEKKEIPKDMDMSDEDYKKSLKDVFELHRDFESKNFNYFYQSQILWDEAMAHSIDKFLKQSPDYQIVVLAGIGHIMYGSGIPNRTYRLNAKNYTTLIFGPENIDEDIGDYVLLLRPISLPPTLRLGILLKEIDDKIKIINIEPESIAERAGLKEDDVLLSVDDNKIEDIEDIKVSMFDKKKGDIINIKTLRKSLAGEKEFEFTITI